MMKKIQRRFFFLVLFFLVYLVPLYGKTPHRVPGVTSEVKIDGILDDAAWQEALVLELKYEVQPGENIEPPVKTEVLLVYNQSHLYAAFRAYDPAPTSISAHIRERDNVSGDDWVAINLDTFNDQRRAYSFICNSLGVQADEYASTEGGGEAWDAIWNSAGRITREGYIVEMAIPFNTLLFQRKSGSQDQVWGIDAVRSYPRNVRHLISLFPWDRSNNCYMCQAEKIIGFVGAAPGKSIELDPTLYSIYTQERDDFPGGDFIEKEKKLDPGLTARWGFTPNLTLSATVNPDFSNVEADIPQLDINTRFAIYYPEKRPFFLEGASIFSTLFRAVHTRALADPDWGIKITGKEGKHAIGFFSVQDHITNLLIPGSQGSRSTSIDMDTWGSALRYRLDVGKSSTMGILATDREGSEYFNRVAGVDTDLKITPKDRIQFQFLGSQTSYPQDISARYNQPLESFWGKALEVYYKHDTRSFDWYGGYSDVGDDFRADLGFMPQAGYRNVEAGLSHSWNRPRGYWFTVLTVGASGTQEKDYQGNLLSKGLTFNFNYIGPVRSYLNLYTNFGKSTYEGIEFDDNHVYFNGAIRPSGSFEFFFNGLMGDGIDLDNIQAGNRFQLGGTVILRLGRHLDLMLDQKFERFNVEAGRLYRANISYLRLVYYFNKRTFLRGILKYVDYKYNADLYVFPIDPRFKHLFSQFLFSYEINPRTVLFLGCSDDYYGDHIVALTQSNRTFFVKVGYALVL
jgi:hypothetical protein